MPRSANDRVALSDKSSRFASSTSLTISVFIFIDQPLRLKEHPKIRRRASFERVNPALSVCTRRSIPASSGRRSLTDLLDFLRDLHAKGVDLFLHQQGLDTSTPSGRAMFQMMGVFAEFERAMIRERVLAGLARAKEQGISLGRRRLEDSDAAKVAAIKRALAAKRGVRRIARDLETGVGTVLRIKNELAFA